MIQIYQMTPSALDNQSHVQRCVSLNLATDHFVMTSASIRLVQLATARSGDKGNHANIGVVATSPAAYEVLQRELTTERVQQFFQHLGVSRVERFELPNVHALNFVLYDALAGGASRSLKIDTQGKLLGTAILDLELPVSAELLPTLSAGDAWNDLRT